MSAALELTKLVSASGVLTKRISLAEDGKLISDGSACVISAGAAMRIRPPTIQAFADLIGSLNPNEAIALGALRSDLPDKVEVTTARKLAEMNGSAEPAIIARNGGHIAYVEKRPAFALLDFDTKGMPAAIADRLLAIGGFWSAVVSVVPELGHCAHVMRRSTSSGISRSDTGESIKGSDGLHLFVLVEDGSDIERFLRMLHDRCWLHGLGWMMVGAGGQLLERSIVDRMVYAAERLVFEGPPILTAPLLQDSDLRKPRVFEGDAVNTVGACRSLTLVEKTKLSELKAKERQRLASSAAKARATFVREHAEKMAARVGSTLERARRAFEKLCGGVLLPDVALPFDAENMFGCTVGDVLADPDRFADATLADPLEGVSYGPCKAKVMRRPDGSVWINSFAHGCTTYDLKFDADAIEKRLLAAELEGLADLLVRLLVQADIAPDEEHRLRDLVSKRTGISARALAAKIKAAKTESAKENARTAKENAEIHRTDCRIRLSAPAPDAERLPILIALDEVLGAVDEPEPPMRDMDGHPVEVRERAPLLLHELASDGVNETEQKEYRLQAPAMPLLTQHDRLSFAHVVERYMEFVIESETGARPVALPQTFIDHSMAWRDSALPRVGAVVTAPLVLTNGSMLAPNGLDRDRKMVFRIPRELQTILPKPGDAKPSPQNVAAAMKFLVNDWLCDVATDFAGKCVLVALALSIIERVLLPERPAFFVTAGKRGGGKTTALAMIIFAVTGKRPAAAAWSSSQEERRKALVAYLEQGLAAMVFDNIPLGSTIACPTIEKILTAESYSDRTLGETAITTVPAFTILTFTGNNIAPKGDLASRSLMVRLGVDRPDPEDRPFRHADPIAWTFDNRGKILRALYVLLLANPQLKTSAPPKTRFKRWWHLVGSAVENAAQCLVAAQSEGPEDERYARSVDFVQLFADVEGEDEDGAVLAEILEILCDAFPQKFFSASEVAKMITRSMDGEEDRASRLRAFFDSETCRRSGSLSSVSVGMRLSKVVDTPMFVSGRVLKLVRNTPRNQTLQRRITTYKVNVVS